MPKKLQVLLADDDETFALLVEKALEKDPEIANRYDLRVVTDGSEAVDYVLGNQPFDDRAACPLPDLVLMDQQMRHMDGSEALRRLKGDPKAVPIPVCMLTTCDEPSLKATCYDYGASFFIKKPLEFESLKHKLNLIVRFFTDVLEATEDN